MVAMLGHLVVLLYASLFFVEKVAAMGRIASFSSLPSFLDSLQSSKEAKNDPSKVIILPTIGLSSDDVDSRVLDIIDEAVGSFNEETTVNKGPFAEPLTLDGSLTSADMQILASSDAIVVYISDPNYNKPFTQLQSYLDTIAIDPTRKTNVNVIILLDPSMSEENIASVKSLIDLVVSNAAYRHSDNKSQVFIPTLQYLNVNIPTDQETFRTLLTSALKTTGMSKKQILQTITKKTSFSSPNFDLQDLAAIEAIFQLTQSFTKELRSAVQLTITEGKGMLQERLTKLETAIITISNANYEKHKQIYSAYLNQASFVSLGSAWSKTSLFVELCNVQTRLSSILKDLLVRSFALQLDELNTGEEGLPADLVHQLKGLRDQKLQQAKELTADTRTRLNEILNVKSDSGLLSTTFDNISTDTASLSPAVKQLLTNTAMMKITQLPADYDIDQTDLRRAFDFEIKQALKAMQLSGKYNPFLRDPRWPLPPIKLSLAYLFDPRDFALGTPERQVGKLWDEHRVGYAPKRADALVFSNVAQIPFDPNYHPKMGEEYKDSTPWWKKVKSFVDYVFNDEE